MLTSLRGGARTWWTLVLGAVALVCAPLVAHHSFAKFYLESDMIEIEGQVIEFQYKNPHCWLFVVGREGVGPEKTYAAEWANPSRLERDGITGKTLREGDIVRVWASPNRDPNDNRVHLKRIERRDGFKWQQRRPEAR
jgi:hypothetical protein